jgi:AcrR family transcriptional regulator
MGSGERRERERAAVRERILSAARELFAQRGIDAVTMRGIAGAIEYTPAALYVHFRDKNDLLRALCRNDFAALNEQQRRVSRVADPVERIRRIGLAVVKFAVTHPNHYRFMFMTPLKVEPAEEDLARRGDPEEDGYAFFVGVVREAMEAGRLRAGDAHLAAQTLWAGVIGVAALHITHAEDPWLPMRAVGVRARAMVDALIAGMEGEETRGERRERRGERREGRGESGGKKSKIQDSRESGVKGLGAVGPGARRRGGSKGGAL